MKTQEIFDLISEPKLKDKVLRYLKLKQLKLDNHSSFKSIIFALNFKKEYYSEIFENFVNKIRNKSNSELPIICEKYYKYYLNSNDYKKKFKITYLFDLLSQNDIYIDDDVVIDLLKNGYRSIRNKGYHIAKRQYNNIYTKLILYNYKKYNDNILELLMNCIDFRIAKKYITGYLNDIYILGITDFKQRLLRSRLLIKLYKYESKRINDLKDSDPLSYMFIHKEMNKKLSDDFLYDYYLNNNGKYLISWFCEMGNFEVVEKILKIEKINIK